MKYAIVGIRGLLRCFLGVFNENKSVLSIYESSKNQQHLCNIWFDKDDFYENYDIFTRRGIEHKVLYLRAISPGTKALLKDFYPFSRSYISVYDNISQRFHNDILVEDSEGQPHTQDINDLFRLRLVTPEKDAMKCPQYHNDV